MYYVIQRKNGDYIGKNTAGRMIFVQDINAAKIWTSKVKAEKTKESLPRYMNKAEFLIIEYEADHLCDDSYLSEQEMSEFCEHIEEKILSNCHFIQESAEAKVYMQEKMKECDQKLSDLLHIAEFENLNVTNGYKVYKKIHDIRKERRKYKDGLLQLSYIFANTNENIIENAKKVEKSVLGLRDRKYTPHFPSLLE